MADSVVSQSEIEHRQSEASPSAFRAWCVLVVQSFQRHWRVRQMGWVSAGLLGLVVLWVAVVTGRGGWDFSGQRARRSAFTNAQEAERLAPRQRYRDLDASGEPEPRALRYRADPARPYDEIEPENKRKLEPYEIPNPLNPTEDALATLILSAPQAVIQSGPFLKSWAFMTYSRWVIMLVFMGFILPLFTLSYASGAFGTERESRSLVWLMTRPIPRSGIYLAKFLGTLPWCVAFGLGGFVAVCLVGGEAGREALARYWPAAAMGTVAFAALFHLIGAIFRRPVVVGLVYVFFFETVVAALPGSLKLLSLTFYARSLMYNEAVAAGHPGDMLPTMTAQAVSSDTAWSVLVAAPIVITLLGMWLFSRSEYRDDV